VAYAKNRHIDFGHLGRNITHKYAAKIMNFCAVYIVYISADS